MIFVVIPVFLLATWFTGRVVIPKIIRIVIRTIQWVVYLGCTVLGVVLIMARIGVNVADFIARTYNSPYVTEVKRFFTVNVPVVIQECQIALISMEEEIRNFFDMSQQPRRHRQHAGENRQETRFNTETSGVRHRGESSNQRLYPDLSHGTMEDGEYDKYTSFTSSGSDLDMDSPLSHDITNTVDSDRVTPSAPAWEDEPQSDVSYPNSSTANGNDDNACIVCMDNARNTAVFPCGHTHMCLQCAKSVVRARNVCPLCQTPITEYRGIFL